MKSLELFSGAGGLAKGLELAGFEHSAFVEYNSDACASLRCNFDPKKVFAEKNSIDVINYVADHKNVLGFVGVSWIGNSEDTSQASFLKKVRIAAITCRCPEQTYVKPYQANIATKRYPLVRGLYYILKENYNGLGGGFANFLTYEKGQLIFRRAYLWPAKMNFTIRSATLN